MPTIGRPTLERALASIEPRNSDEVIVVSADPGVASRVVKPFGYPVYLYEGGNSIAGGARERQYGISKATGDYLVFLDDDDVMAPGGLELIRSELRRLNRPLPVLFRVQQPGGFIWGDDGPSLTLGEVTGSQFVCPNDPDKLVPWPVDPSGDCPFIGGVIAKYGGEYKAVDRVIIRIRPEQI